MSETSAEQAGTLSERASVPRDPAARLALLGRWLLLSVLAGHLLLRREFAHRNLGDLVALSGATPPRFLSYAYVTEVAMLLLLPLAALVFWRRRINRVLLPPGEAALNYGMGAAVYAAAGLLLWGAWHSLAALAGGNASAYLVLRQSALCAYAVFFVYAYLFFGDREKFVRSAAVFLVVVSVGCAIGDIFGAFKPSTPDPLYPNEMLFGQETLPIAILALGLYIVYLPPWYWIALASIGLALAGWRQSHRLPQSVVPIGIGGAVFIYLLYGGLLALRGQVFTFKRAVLLAALFGVLFLGYRSVKKLDRAKATEIQAWSVKKYQDLLDVYDHTTVPADPKDYVVSTRAPGTVVKDAETYKLNAVYDAAQKAGGPSVVNNVWRVLMWRRMWQDWLAGRPVYGAGVGRTWAYNEAFYSTRFHYETDKGGLNPHNSYLNLLYRYGAVGMALFLTLVIAVLWNAWRALRIRTSVGDPLLEGLLLYFIYTAIFSFFTVSLEGPSYALPFWVSLGLVYARAWQIVTLHNEGLLYA